jgi:hypothetical protein
MASRPDVRRRIPRQPPRPAGRLPGGGFPGDAVPLQRPHHRSARIPARHLARLPRLPAPDVGTGPGPRTGRIRRREPHPEPLRLRVGGPGCPTRRDRPVPLGAGGASRPCGRPVLVSLGAARQHLPPGRRVGPGDLPARLLRVWGSELAGPGHGPLAYPAPVPSRGSLGAGNGRPGHERDPRADLHPR